ncbi:XrtA system polysaccharide chain length determinant [Nitratidesulfovibrio sp.]|uniref:XrtA system polysaccharide chain length determinant n=1 Tax=Nitratidesulfovibrio sp. TaxID=2802297 RepID=UPI003342D84A
MPPEGQRQERSCAPAAEGPDIRRHLALLRERAVPFCIITVVVTLLGVAASYVLPKRYQANSTVSIEQNVISDFVKGIAITPSLEAKMRIIKVSVLSRRTLLQVIQDLDMDLDAKGDDLERLIETTRNNVDIGHDEKKGLFYIHYVNSSPVRARDFVNTLTRRYIEESTASKREESYEATRFLSDQIAVFQKRIDTAQQGIDEFKSDKGLILSLNENILREEIKETEHRLGETRIRKNERLAQLNIMEHSSSGGGKLAEKEATYRAMLRTYTERHPDMVRARNEIEAMRVGPPSGGGRTASLEYQRVKVELDALTEMERAQLELLEKDKRLLQELPAVQTELKVLEQTRQNEMLIYEQLVARYGQSEVSKQMELQDKAVSFRIIEPAILPLVHKFPNRPLIMIGSIFFGMALAAGSIVAHDIAVRRVRSLEDLTSLGCQVLGVLPRIETLRDTALLRRRAWAMGITAVILLLVSVLALAEYLGFHGVDSLFARIRASLFNSI